MGVPLLLRLTLWGFLVVRAMMVSRQLDLHHAFSRLRKNPSRRDVRVFSPISALQNTS